MHACMYTLLPFLLGPRRCRVPPNLPEPRTCAACRVFFTWPRTARTVLRAVIVTSPIPGRPRGGFAGPSTRTLGP